MSTVLATSTTTEAAPPPTAPGRKFQTLRQAEIALEFCTDYGLEESQISFEGEKLDPIFDFDALSILALALTDIQDISVDIGDVNQLIGLVTASCAVTLASGRTRRVFGSCMVGELMHDNTSITSIQQALSVARSRGQRVGLRAVGFDPVRAHRERKDKNTGATTLSNETDQRTKELAEIHMHAETLGFIKGEDKSLYYQNMGSFFPNVSSAGVMNDGQRAQWLGILRAWVRAREVASSFADQTQPAAK